VLPLVARHRVARGERGAAAGLRMSAGYRDVAREDFARVLAQIRAAVKPGRIYTLDVGHDYDCPCAGNRAPMPACTCQTVDVQLTELQ
jgi:predicted alpha/beta hydrolase